MKASVCIVLALCVLQLARASPNCTANDKYNNSRLFITTGEYFPFFMDDYFTGENLTFVNKTELPAGFFINNTIEEIQNSSITEVDQNLIAIATHEAYDGSVYLGILSGNEDGEYAVNFGNSYPDQYLPDVELKILLPFDVLNYHCYDLQFLNPYEFVVGCINITNITDRAKVSMTELVLVNVKSSETAVFQFENWEKLH